MGRRVRSVSALIVIAGFSATPALAQLPDLGGSVPDVGGSVDTGGLQDGLGLGGSDIPSVPPLQEAPGRLIIDHPAAVEAVQDHRALPLDDVLKSVARTYQGQVIDVQLVRAQTALLYEIKMIDRRGTVSLVYYDAATGKPAALPRR
jgi:hypothetical protein